MMRSGKGKKYQVERFADSCVGLTPGITPPGVKDIQSATSMNLNSPDIQAVHQKSYDNLNNAFAKAMKSALTFNDYDKFLKFLDVDGGLSYGNNYGINSNDLPEVLYAYDSEWIEPATRNDIDYFKNFIKFALTRIPRGKNQFVEDTDGGALSCTADDGQVYKTFFDFHVMRLGELSIATVLFALSSKTLGYIVTTQNIDKDIQKISMTIEQIENTLSYPIDDDDSAHPGDLKSPENIYMAIKALSTDNSSSAVTIARMQEGIDMRQQSLQTALNAEMHVDNIMWWSGFTMWMWVAISIGVLVSVVFALAWEAYLIIYITLIAIAVVQIFGFILGYFGYNASLFDIAGIRDTASLELSMVQS